ncbi:MAG: hypothetical protein IKR17_11970 [Bacteroidales bacterium]|nr:hypothetical protein [Bacteroidales bacterium]
MKHFSYIFLITTFVANTYAQTPTQDVAYTTLDSINYSADFKLHNAPDLIYTNPAMRHNVYSNTQTTIAVGYRLRDEDEAIILQEGSGDRLGVVNIESVTNKRHSALWGKARFIAGKRINVLYNETSDFRLLAPYVMGDTVGGDLTSQTYIFGGGLVHTLGESNFSIGIDANYRACLEYRQIDPRPRNSISELQLNIGIAYNSFDKYEIAIHANGMRYKQTNEVKFFSNLGKPITFHYTGIGTDYYRFRGSNVEAYYNGYNGGGGVDFVHKSTGISAAFLYQYQTFEKILSSLNNLPLTRTTEHLIDAQVGYTNATRDRHEFHIETIYATASINSKTGRENIFGDAQDNIYNEIGYVEQYKCNRTDLSATCVANKTFSKNSLTLRADAGTLSEKHSYALPTYELSFTQANFGARIEDLISASKYYLFIAASATHNAALSSQINLPSANIRDVSPEVYYKYMSHSSTLFALRAHLQIPTKTKYGINLFADTNATFTHLYNGKNQVTLSLTIGAQL